MIYCHVEEDKMHDDDKKIHPYITELSSPPISETATPQIPRFVFLLGSLQYGFRNSITDRSQLKRTPFLVFLHPTEKTLLIAFDYNPIDEESGDCDSVKLEDSPFWYEASTGSADRFDVLELPRLNITKRQPQQTPSKAHQTVHEASAHLSNLQTSNIHTITQNLCVNNSGRRTQ